MRGEGISSVHYLRENVAGRDKADLIALAQAECATEGEIRWYLAMDQRLSLLTHSEIDRPVLRQGGAKSRAHFPRIARAADDHARQGTEKCDVLAGVMSGPQASVGKSSAYCHDNYRRLVVAYIDAYLFEAARGDEGRNRVGNRAETREREPCRNSDHVLLGHATVEKP
jgi:hypothetical protein